MDETGRTAAASRYPIVTKLDAVIVGAGFAGMYLVLKLRRLGLRALAFEAGPDIGGVWYWNNYPGARCDGESLVYSYSFDSDLEQEWEWPERFSAQPDILRYARHVADRFDLRRDIVFDTRVSSASWDDTAKLWRIATDRGDAVEARFFVSAVGNLSTTQIPDVPGLDRFQGDWYHTGAWPRNRIDFTGKRVGVVGTGSSGVQAIPEIAQEAADMTVFQRTPNYVVPAKNGPLDKAIEADTKARYAEFRELSRTVGLGLIPLNPQAAAEVSDDEREAEFRKRWDHGGPMFMMSFTDMMTDPVSNEHGAEFIRARIREIVEDPETADRLSPKNYPIGAKRICVGTDYYETYNRPNVHLVDVKADPIARIEPDGIRLASDRFVPLDSIVFATGYDAMTGSLLKMDIRGRNGVTLAEKWETFPSTYLGIATSGFPNFFFITGPGSPSVIGNVIMAIEQHVEWLGDLLEWAERAGVTEIEADPGIEKAWGDHVNEVANGTLFPRADSWYMSKPVPGQPRSFLPYIGAPAYRRIADDIAARGYGSFRLNGAAPVDPA